MYTIQRPLDTEFAPFYGTYINQVESDNFLNALRNNKASTNAFLLGIPEAKWDYAYAPGKWTLKETIIHVIDAERVFAYRALRIARNDKTPMPGFDQDVYVPFSGAASRSSTSVIEEFKAVRDASIHLFDSMDDEALTRLGIASGNSFSPRALGFIIAGHENHHLRIIRERYL